MKYKIKPLTVVMALLTVSLVFAGCSAKADDTPGKKASGGVTDLQLAMLNSVLYHDELTDLEGESIEGHAELIDRKYIDHIAGGDTLIDQLKGYTLIDYDYGDVTGFKAAAFTKGKQLVIVYGGTDHPTDFVDDVFSGLFDFSAQDGQAKAFAKDNVKKHRDYDLYITGYSLGGRLCYLGTEEVIDNQLGDNLKRVCTFNGLGVKEAFDFTDSNLSNIHNLESKFANKSSNYIVKDDFVSDRDSERSFQPYIGYLHIGAEIKVPCTNQIDGWPMTEHDLYSIIDYLLNHTDTGTPIGKPTPTPAQSIAPDPTAAPAAVPTEPPRETNLDFLIGDWSTSDGVLLSFSDDGSFKMEWGYFPAENGKWHAEAISENAYYLEMDGSRILSLMSLVYGAADSDYHFEILRRDRDNFYLVQVYGDYTATTSPCKLSFTRLK